MFILGIETATIVCGVSIIEYLPDPGSIKIEKNKFTVLAGLRAEQERVHSEKLVLFVDQAVRKTKIKLSALDGIAVSIGPGSFTGLRIGLSTAKGLAFGLQKPLLAVPTLEALAFQASFMGQPVMAALDAKRNEIFWELFPASFTYGTNHHKFQLNSYPDAFTGKYKKCLVVGNINYTQALDNHFISQTQIPNEEYRLPDASSVAILGAMMLQNNLISDLSTLDADYGRDFKGIH
jgi:tRNA threonylcarbamoyladenosine biosynthesis protein TsaB